MEIITEIKKEIIKDSQTLMVMVSNDIEPEDLSEEELDEILTVLPINLDLLYKFYENQFIFEENNLLKLINDLNYLGNTNLDDVLLLSKYLKSKYIEIALNADLKKTYDSLSSEEDKFLTFVKRGNLKICKLLYNFCKIDIHSNEDDAFISSCETGHLEVAKWLYYDLGGIDIHSNKDQAFRWSCENGHLEVAKWLYYDLGGIDIHTNEDQAFRWSCGNGHLEVAKWLYNDLGGIDIHTNEDQAFRWSCENGHLEVAKWLYYDLGGIDIRIQVRYSLKDLTE